MIIQFHYNSADHEAIKKWKHRHSKLGATLFVDHQCRSSRTNIIQIDCNGKNPSEIAPILKYFNKKCGELYILKSRDPWSMYCKVMSSPILKAILSQQPGQNGAGRQELVRNDSEKIKEVINR